MATVARPPQQEPRQHDCRVQSVADTFDPDDVLTTHDSPPMQVLRPRLEPSPSPPPDIPPAHIRPSSGDAVLVSYLDNGRCPDIARTAGVRALADDHDKLNSNIHHDHELQHLAADALQAVSADISASTRQLSIAENACCLSRQQHPAQIGYNSSARSAARELPPLQMASPKSESNSGRSLPSIRSTLGDLTCMVPSEPPTPADHDSATGRLPPLSATHMSPPISPSEAYQRSLPSPHSLPASSPYNYYSSAAAAAAAAVSSSSSSSFKQRSALMDYSTNAAGETPATDHSDSTTPATTTSVADRMSIDGITHPQVGVYVCNFSGCTALPFQTQYLLNSHANVHSSARPHYCPVKDCPRSEGGKGFKRKNEMIRHGLVHDSPGYVCPFCPDREHKYPRPDNLQRCATVNQTIRYGKDDIGEKSTCEFTTLTKTRTTLYSERFFHKDQTARTEEGEGEPSSPSVEPIVFGPRHASFSTLFYPCAPSCPISILNTGLHGLAALSLNQNTLGALNGKGHVHIMTCKRLL